MYKVIIVEDEMFVRLGMKSIISWEKYNMEVAADFAQGALALEYYLKERPELVITDIKMPVMDGLTLIRKIREVSEETQIILLTCVEEFEMAQEAIRHGALGYISKLSMADDEFESLIAKAEQVLDHMQSKQSFSAAAENDKKAVLREFLRRITCSDIYDEEQICNYIHNLGIDLDENGLTLCMFHMDRPDTGGQDSHWEKNVIQDAVLNLLKETLDQVCHGEVTSYSDEDYLMFLNFPGIVREAECKKKIEELSANVCTAVRRYFNITGFIGISTFGGDYLSLPEKLKEASQALEERFVTEPEKGFAWYKESRNCEFIHEMLFDLLSDDAKSMLTVKELEIFRQRIRNFQSEGPLLRRDVLNLMYELSQSLIRNSLMNSEQKQELMLNVYRQFEQCLNIHEVITCFKETVSRVKRDSGYHKGIRQEIIAAREYIDQNYKRDLTLGEMAEYAGLSQSYFSTLFKKELGKNFAEYLYELRIERAKELLLHSDDAVYEISEAAGFKDHAYFSRLFKSKTGESPGEYRKNRTVAEEKI